MVGESDSEVHHDDDDDLKKKNHDLKLIIIIIQNYEKEKRWQKTKQCYLAMCVCVFVSNVGINS